MQKVSYLSTTLTVTIVGTKKLKAARVTIYNIIYNIGDVIPVVRMEGPIWVIRLENGGS